MLEATRADPLFPAAMMRRTVPPCHYSAAVKTMGLAGLEGQRSPLQALREELEQVQLVMNQQRAPRLHLEPLPFLSMTRTHLWCLRCTARSHGELLAF